MSVRKIGLVGYADSLPGLEGKVLVGRKVANRAFLEALLRHGRAEHYAVFAGETAELTRMAEVAARETRLSVHPLVEIQDRLASGELDVVHQASHLDALTDLCALRDVVRAPTSVTGQIHSLSYPRHLRDYLRWIVQGPSVRDAIFCSSECGREVVRRAVAAASTALQAGGLPAIEIACDLPVVPLGVDAERLAFGKGPELRAQAQIPPGAVVALSIGRFSEYDKADLFPLVQVCAGLRLALAEHGTDFRLLLAGASQGVGTQKALQAWARALGMRDGLHFCIDFPADAKADLLAAADLFVAPSDNPQETFGLSVVEAMAAGVPVVAADYDGYRETVGEAGVLVPTTQGGAWEEHAALMPLLYERPLHLLFGQSLAVDLDELQAALAALVRDAGLRARFGALGAARVRERYDWRVVIPAYEAIWEEVTGRSTPAGAAAARPLAFDLRTLFGHYPSTWLDGEDELELAPLGRFLLEQGVEHPVRPDVRPFVPEAAVSAAVRRLEEGPCRARDLLETVREALGPNAPLPARREPSLVVPWLLKHGLARRLPGGRT